MQLKVKGAIFLFIFFIISPKFLYSQEFTLKEAVDYALGHNPSILIAKNKIEKTKVILKDAKRLLDLDVSVQFGYGPLTDRRGIGFGISQDLDRLLGGNKKEKDLAKLDLDSVRQEFILIQQQVTKEVIKTFGNLESAKCFLSLKKEAYLNSQKSLDLAKEKFNLGIISMDELLNKQQAERLLEFEFQQAQKDLKESYLIFYQAIGYKEEQDSKD
jgi:outer membrane protein TolC